jgi:hypothetical protein
MSWTLASLRAGAAILVTTSVCAQGATGAMPQAVVELFTSQGCSSCPPADAVAGRLLANPQVLVLSFHVNYWDDLGWKDPFSSASSTDRQYAYARALGERSVFTPQLIVNGTQSLVGSQESAVQRVVAGANKTDFPIRAELAAQPDGSFSLTLAGPEMPGELWEVRYVHHSVTSIRGGENDGRELETFNNVTRIRHIGRFRAGTFKLASLRDPEDGIAVFVQAPAAGRILGAASYPPR